MLLGALTAGPLIALFGPRATAVGLTAVGLVTLAARMRTVSAAAGRPIMRQGEHGDILYVLKSGAVDVTARAADGQDTHLATLGPTDYFGEVARTTSSASSARPRWLRTVAGTPSTVVRAATSRLTVELAPMMALSPTVIRPTTTALGAT